jgi:starvation-inducible DNA-binding protein
MHKYNTRNDLSSNAKAVSTGTLNARLADAIDLALLTKQAHWNIKGPQFIALHEMIDGLRTEIDTHVDTTAERIVQLGGTALGTSQAVASASTVAPYPTDIHSSKDHLAALIERYAKVANAVRTAIDETGDAGDADTADLFTAFSRALDKALWFLEAHVQEKEQGLRSLVSEVRIGLCMGRVREERRIVGVSNLFYRAVRRLTPTRWSTGHGPYALILLAI